jgi:elongation factor P--(R)-beta-lysine ligase
LSPRNKRLDVRARVTREARELFASRGYDEVETPCLVPSPGLDVHLAAFEVSTVGKSRYLHTSPEYQMKRLLADAWARGERTQRVFQITRAYREGERGERHNPEFTILEFYRAPGTMADTLRDTEQLVAKVTSGAVRLGARTIACMPPFRRMTVAEAFATFANVDEDKMLALAEKDEDTFFRRLVDHVEPGLAALDHAVFLTHYPACQASLARTVPGDPRYAERYELYVAGVELCNGFGELTDAREQRARFEHDLAERALRSLPLYPIDERFLAALESGLPECSGNAIGLDRLAALAAGTTNIGDVLAFTDGEL